MAAKNTMQLSNRESKPSFKGYRCRACTPNPIPLGPHRYQAEVAWKRIATQPPKWSLGVKPEMVIGGVIPSWAKSIPGPKYNPDIDKCKNVAPSWTLLKRFEYPGGANALQGRLEKEYKAELKQAEKVENEGIQDLNQFCNFSDADFLRASASPSMLAGLSTAQLLQLRGKLSTATSPKLSTAKSAPALNHVASGSTAHVPISRALASSGRSQVCSMRSRSGCYTGSSFVSLDSAQRQKLSEAVHLELERQLQALRDADQPISRQQLTDAVLTEIGKQMQPRQVVAQPVGRRQRLMEILQRANGSS